MVEAPPLLAWLEEQIDADERIAREATPGPWLALDSGVVSYDDPDDESGQGVWPVDVAQSSRDRQDRTHIACWDPKRALAECAAKRRVLDRHTPNVARGIVRGVRLADSGKYGCSCCGRLWPCPDVLDVAVVYQDRDGWHDGWTPRA